MKLAFITPTSYLDQFSSQGDIYLALAHLTSNKEYLRFHQREAAKGKTVYLDNGLFEGAQVDPEALLHITKSIGASVVCAPDVLYDSKATIKAFKSFIKLKQELGIVVKVMGIPQADNPQDWWDSYQFFDTCKDCDMIGLSILSVPKAFGGSITESRKDLIKQLFAHSIISGRRLTPMHMLGLGESYADIKEATSLLPRDIVSNDSSSAFVHGMCGVRYAFDGSIPGGKIEEKLDFSIKQVPHEEVIQENIDIAKAILND